MTKPRFSKAGPPKEPLSRLQRDETDKSLREERDSAEQAYSESRRDDEDRADAETQRSRDHSDDQTRNWRAATDLERPPQTTEQTARSGRERDRADGARDIERSSADSARTDARANQRQHLSDLLSRERTSTDLHLGGERTYNDESNVDMREANQRMVAETLHAMDLRDEADQAKAHAQEQEQELRKVAEFRELFIGILGHDLRNPLNAIGMAVGSMLRRGRLDEQDAKAASRIVRSAQRMTDMITQLLDLTRARLGGGLAIDPQPAELKEICRDVLEEFDGPTRLDAEGDLSGSWDRHRLAEALSNLVGNAMTHADPGTGVTLKARSEGDWVRVEVQNQGPPIRPEVLPFIFEPFRGAEDRGRDTGGNLGLGLFIAQQIVLAHRGTLSGQSEGGITTFTLRLPRHPPVADGGSNGQS